MLNQDQIKYLCRVSDLAISQHNDIIYGINCGMEPRPVTISYAEFALNMGLPSPRLHWLTSNTCFMSGGAVLSWLLQDDTYNDVDFFFTARDAAENFALFIQQYDFKETNHTNYAKTFFHKEDGVILQVVGAGEHEFKYKPDGTAVRLLGKPHQIMENFDITVCQFSIDCDNFYTNTIAVKDLISRTLNADVRQGPDTFFNKIKGVFGVDKNPAKASGLIERVLKYHHKGFFIPNPAGVSYDPNTRAW